MERRPFHSGWRSLSQAMSSVARQVTAAAKFL
jgi:hypothetical protein